MVCMGNICRSPTAEGVMRSLVREAGREDEFVIDSAGTGGWHVGDAPDRRATEAAGGRGGWGGGPPPARGPPGAPRAGGVAPGGPPRQLRESDFEDFDLLLAMDR